MQFEDFDSKLRQAADQHHPNYDEKAWAKMQGLLDQHLPIKKDRDRRIIFLFLLFLLAGGGAWVIISKPWQQGNATISASKTPNRPTTNNPTTAPKDIPGKSAVSTVPVDNVHDNVQPGETPSAQTEKNSSANPTNTVAGKETQLTIEQPNESKNEKDQRLNVTTNTKSNATSSKQNKPIGRKNNGKNPSAVAIVVPANARKGNRNVSEKASAGSVPANSTSVNANDNSSVAMTDKTQAQNAEPAASSQTKSQAEVEKKDKAAEPVTTDKKKEVAKKSPGSKTRNYFSFSFSVGPDLSYISLSDPGEVKLLSGAGVGYTFKNRWTIRTGFYAVSKIYTANKYNYKPANPGPTANLEKIDADCRVYEVPLSIAYNFSKAEKHSFFGSMGLSSLFMKKEEYRYLYKYPGPPVVTYTHTKELYNENKHYFSVLTLSAGYGKRLNNTFSVSAEPYFKLPLSGIGYGHVKLSSMGVLLSVNVTPFRH